MDIRKITIAGAGTMGYSMAEIFARKGRVRILGPGIQVRRSAARWNRSRT